MSTRRIPLLFAAAALLVPVSEASAASVTVSAAAKEGRTVLFELEGVRGATRAKLRARAHRRDISGKRLRRAIRKGHLRARVPAGVQRSDARLIVFTRKRPRSPIVVSPTPTEPAPTPTPTEPAPTPTPTEPVPTPTDGVASVLGCGYGTFTYLNLPGSCWRPYADTSPFNHRLPASPRLASNSSAVVSRLNGFGTPQNLLAGPNSEDWEHPVYYSQPTDPVYTLNCTEPWGTCAVEGMQVRIPAAAKPSNSADAHLTVVDQATGWEYDMWGVTSKPATGGRLDFQWGGRTRIDGDGLGSDATASRFGGLAGIIRAQEMKAGHIPHALFMVVECDNGKFVYPASKNGRSCDKIGLPTENAPAMGTRFILDMTDAEIGALSVPAWKKTILRAMAQYGMYVGDTGTGSWGLQFESGATYESFGMEDEMVTFARSAGVPLSSYSGDYVFNLRDGVDWQNRLKVVDPCVAQRTC